ncbi:EamA family transporter [candidate division WOR-3 bacterium]|nr:EamA family transporter [candidate division WOR-3 bacterium]
MTYVKYAVIALVGWGFWAIGGKMLTRYFSATSTTFWVTFWSMFFIIIYIAVTRTLTFSRYAFYAIPVGIVSFIAILAFYKALQLGPSSVVVPFTNMYVIFPVLFGFIVLKEAITLTRVLGILCALLATILLAL